MNIKTLFAGIGLLAAQTLAAQNILIAPANPGASPDPNFGGECLRAGRIGWAEVKDVSFSIANTPEPATVGVARSGGKVVPGNFNITKKIDGSSQFFLSNCMAGRVIPVLTIENVIENINGDFIGSHQVITLYDVIVVSYKQGSAPMDGGMEEMIGFNYNAIKIVYNRVNREGGVINGKPYGWNWKTNSSMQ